MIAVVRLYRQHDLDLMTLYYNERIQLGRLMKKVLLNYVSETEKPMLLDFEEPESTNGYIPKCVRIHINLSESNEADRRVIALLKEIKPGYKCAFIKALFRNTCTYLPMIAYTEGSDFAMRKSLRTVAITDPELKPEAPVDKVTESRVESVKVEPAKVQSDPTPVAPVLPKPAELKEDTNNSMDSLDDMFDSFNKLG